MPPRLASLLTFGFIFFLFRRDFREKPNVTRALWIPTLWLFINESRYISEWLEMFGISIGGSAVEDGSPADALFYFGLIASGIYVLGQRRVSLASLIRQNIWIAAFLGYCFISIAWSDFPFIGLKRWVKTLGHPTMALIVLTEPDPEEAIRRLMKRCAYVLLPVSVLYIKYYPEWGRGFSDWTGAAFNMGIARGKNQLGIICLILGYFFFWHFLQIRRTEKTKARREELLLIFALLGMILWLLNLAHSSTSMVSLFVGITSLLVLGMRFDKRNIGTYLLVVAGVALVAETVFGVSDEVIRMLGKDPTLTDRTLLWNDLLQSDINPILGTGFETFWVGERRISLWQKFKWGPNQAHNGYLETYLNLGVVGLFLLLAIIVSTFWKCRAELLRNLQFGRYRLGFLIAVVFYNWTEASFKALHPVWTMFYIIALDYSRPRPRKELEIAEESGRIERSDLASEKIPVTR